MQQVVFFSLDFEKESTEFLDKLDKASEDRQNENHQSPYQPISINLLMPNARKQDILEKYKGIELGLPEEWFHFNDRIQVNIIEKSIPIEGSLKMLLYMPKGGTPIKLIVNDDYAENPVLTIRFITNINFGDQGAIKAFEQQCDEKLVQFQGNIQLLNEEIKSFNERLQKETVPAAR